MWKALLKYVTDIIHIMPGYGLMEGINLQNPSVFVLTDVYFFCFCYISNVGWCRALCHLVKNGGPGASLVAQWLRICLPMQGTRVRALVWEDPTCRRATGPVSHNY